MMALECQNLTVRYHEASVPALDNIGLTLAAGERVALLGLNGSGKTTLLLAIAGLMPYSGRIVVGGSELSWANLKAVRAKLGFLFSTPDDQLLFPRVLDDVAFGLKRQGVERAVAQARAQELLGELGVGELAERAPHQLSQGQRQRVALAGALITRPQLLLLDEPTSSLDPPGRRELARLLCGYSCAMLLATHDGDFARRVATRYILLEEGHLHTDTHDAAVLEF